MTTLSKEANLSKKYTNHCVRTTTITVLDRSGFEARHIMSVSGHKKVESIQSYSAQTPQTKKREMSDSLSSALGQDVPPRKFIKTPPTACHSVQENNQKPGPPPPPQVVPQGSDPFEYSFRDFLELSEQESEQVLNEIFNTEMKYEEPKKIGPDKENANNMQVAVNKTVHNVSPVLCKDETSLANFAGSIMPKMMFNNSNVTINFNMVK